MDALSWSLLSAAASIGVIHTLLGPDHYLPFIFLGRARGWSAGRTAGITAAFGAAHVLSSVLLGTVGLILGSMAARIEWLEAARGSLAAWALVAFGIAYGVWGLRRSVRHTRGLEPHSLRNYLEELPPKTNDSGRCQNFECSCEYESPPSVLLEADRCDVQC